MSTLGIFLLGVAAPPVAVGSVLVIWYILGEGTRWFIRFTTWLHPDSHSFRRAQLGAAVYATDRAWALTIGSSRLIVTHGYRSASDTEFIEVRNLLQEIGK